MSHAQTFVTRHNDNAPTDSAKYDEFLNSLLADLANQPDGQHQSRDLDNGQTLHSFGDAKSAEKALKLALDKLGKTPGMVEMKRLADGNDSAPADDDEGEDLD